MTLFQDVTATAPADADFICYRSTPEGVWPAAFVFAIRRKDNGFWSSIANVDAIGREILAAGISANRQSLWNHDDQYFVAGDLEQLTRYDTPADRAAKAA